MVDGSGLENRRAERHRGFESHPLRFPPMKDDGQGLERRGQTQWGEELPGGDPQPAGWGSGWLLRSAVPSPSCSSSQELTQLALMGQSF